MEYLLQQGHGLRHDPFKALIAPRPIGWISTVSSNGHLNLAPYSFFNIISESPHMVMFSSAGKKDSLTNAESTGEFVCSLASYDQRLQIVATSAALASHESEWEHAGLTPAPSHIVKPPRVLGAPAALECRYVKTIDLDPRQPGSGSHHMVIGEVVAIYIADEFISDGLVDTSSLAAIGRGGYMDYFLADNRFNLIRPNGE